MAELFKAHYKHGKLFCGYCEERIARPTVLIENGGARLVECPHCFRLNKVTLTK